MTKITTGLLITSCVGIAILGTWGSVLFHKTPSGRLASSIPWPIACSLHGCISSAEWASQRVYDLAFAQKTRKETPSEQATLTTVIRRHIISHASLKSAVSIQDAVKYRTAILHTTDIASITPLGMKTFGEYDSAVILPFLQQEALMQQYKFTNTSELYSELSKKRKILFLLFNYRWNIDKGEVE